MCEEGARGTGFLFPVFGCNRGKVLFSANDLEHASRKEGFQHMVPSRSRDTWRHAGNVGQGMYLTALPEGVSGDTVFRASAPRLRVLKRTEPQREASAITERLLEDLEVNPGRPG